MELTTVAERLAKMLYQTDSDSHIEVDQAAARQTGAGTLLVQVCPAKVYSLAENGDVGVTHAACLECGTCRQVAPSSVLTWHYPEGGMGINYRQG